MAKRESGTVTTKAKGSGGKAPKLDKAQLRLVTNAAAAKAGGDGKKPNVKLSSQREEDEFSRWYDRINKQDKVCDKARDVVREENGRLGELIKSAGDAGINTRVLKKAIKLAKQSPASVAEEMREMGWQLTLMKAPVATQLKLFTFGEPTLEEYEMMGEQAGRRGEPMENAPGKPTDDSYIHFVSGWKKGQLESAEKVFVKPPAEDAKPQTVN